MPPATGVRCAAPNSRSARARLEARGVELVASTQFVARGFAAWAEGRRRLLMEDFYREQRRAHGLLLDEDGGPDGGRWNFDKENRRPPQEGLRAPEPWPPEEDEIDEEVRRDLDRMALPELRRGRPARAGPATAAEARRALEDFVAHRLAGFGPWQDAMVEGERWLFHSPPVVVAEPVAARPARVRAAPPRRRTGRARAAAIRRGLHPPGRRLARVRVGHVLAPRLPARRRPRADRRCPRRSGRARPTHAACPRRAARLRETGYAHHIERLMVLGNLLLLLACARGRRSSGSRRSFIDGAEWVMAPNAAGMATHADGGR